MELQRRGSTLLGTTLVQLGLMMPAGPAGAQARDASATQCSVMDPVPPGATSLDQPRPRPLAGTFARESGPKHVVLALPSSPTASDPPNVWLTSLEIAMGLGGGAIWYVIDDRNVLDWDKPSMKERLNGEAWRFDSNGFAINYLFHPLAGAGFHALARSNELGFWGSSAASVAGSTAWEYVIEFNEKVSINDMMVTPLGGIPIGEFAHKLGVHLAESHSGSPLGSAVAWALGPSVALNDSLNGRRRPACGHRASSPSGCKQWHEFRVGFEFAWISTRPGSRNTAEALSLDGTLVSLPGYRTASHLTRWFGHGEVSRLKLLVSTSHGRVRGHLDTETLLAGIHHQRIQHDGRRNDGVAVTAAAALGYRYRTGEALGFDDRQGLLHFPGPAVDLVAQAGGFGAELRGRAAFDFAGISTLAAPSWLASYDNDGGMRTKTIVQRARYFFGWGPSITLFARAWGGPLWAEADWYSGRYDSTEGLDRAQEEVTNDVDLNEITSEYQYRLGVSPTFGVGIAAFRKVNKRLSYAGAQSTSVRVEELGLSASVSF